MNAIVNIFKDSQNSRNVDEMKQRKREFNKFIHEAKAKEENGDLSEARRLYSSALSLMPNHEKLASKIVSIDSRIEKISTLTQYGDNPNFWYDSVSDEYLLDPSHKHYFSMESKIFKDLFPHQRDGIVWMWSLYKKKSGGILGDDMGLGKTIQVAAFLHGLFHSQLIDKVLLILPLSVMQNWENELRKWCPKKRIASFHGSQSKCAKALEEILEHSGIVITTYGTAQSSAFTLAQHNNKAIDWDLVILDEGHKIKDPSKKTTKAIRTFQSRAKLLLSGTPIMNNLKELWALLDYVCDGQLLGDAKVFKREFEEPITRGSMRDATEFEKKKGVLLTSKLRTLIEPHFLRREKAEVFKDSTVSKANTNSSEHSTTNTTDENSLESKRTPISPTSNSKESLDRRKSISKASRRESLLPKSKLTLTVKKFDYVCWIPMTSFQVAKYKKFLEVHQEAIFQAIAEKGHALPAIQMLRKITNHPSLISSQSKYDIDKEILDPSKDSASSISSPISSTLSKALKYETLSGTELASQSGKLIFTLELLERLRNEGHRVLLFSQSVRMIDIIEKTLNESPLKIKMIRMDGSISKPEDRQRLITQYNNDPSIFLFMLTTQVGGVGLTLTSANRVIVFDPAWNIAMDDQAVDRAYRIGQTRDVIVYRLITSGTIEEKMYRKQVFKGALSRSLLGKTQQNHTYFTRSELRELFSFNDSDVFKSDTQLLLTSVHNQDQQSKDKNQQNSSLTLISAELAQLSTMTRSLVGLSDHGKLYSEASAVSQELTQSDDSDKYLKFLRSIGQNAESAMASTIVPRDVIELEKSEAAAMMGEQKQQKVLTSSKNNKVLVTRTPNAKRHLDGPGRPARELGSHLILDEQLTLGLLKMSIDVSEGVSTSKPSTTVNKPTFDQRQIQSKPWHNSKKGYTVKVSGSVPSSTPKLPIVHTKPKPVIPTNISTIPSSVEGPKTNNNSIIVPGSQTSTQINKAHAVAQSEDKKDETKSTNTSTESKTRPSIEATPQLSTQSSTENTPVPQSSFTSYRRIVEEVDDDDVDEKEIINESTDSDNADEDIPDFGNNEATTSIDLTTDSDSQVGDEQEILSKQYQSPKIVTKKHDNTNSKEVITISDGEEEDGQFELDLGAYDDSDPAISNLTKEEELDSEDDYESAEDDLEDQSDEEDQSDHEVDGEIQDDECEVAEESELILDQRKEIDSQSEEEDDEIVDLENSKDDDSEDEENSEEDQDDIDKYKYKIEFVSDDETDEEHSSPIISKSKSSSYKEPKIPLSETMEKITKSKLELKKPPTTTLIEKSQKSEPNWTVPRRRIVESDDE